MYGNTAQKDANAINVQSLQRYCLIPENYLILKRMSGFPNIQSQHTLQSDSKPYTGK